MAAADERNPLVWPVLTAMLVITAVAVSYSVHQARKLTAQSQQLQREQYRLHTEWGQLLLEESTWGSFARVEQLARQELKMKQPAASERVVVRP
ncbi:cell division protein FtsL [Alcanivorax sp. S71-1-4]|jgi:cell division protein FtsL|uniref:cell division protein FtsL n=1 Tax=Alcanivorax sp. S71-1-4 TaxID=1177159 RepID=UPI0016B6C92A|nr:cell division protein FtsL [Alcanivorax sp. S71-1-4]KAF0808963.1 cell division protein FtsL [Alcanivorax sp. S71-1-4]